MNYFNYGFLNASSLPSFGGYYSYGANAGAFYLSVGSSAANSYANFGGRLMFL